MVQGSQRDFSARRFRMAFVGMDPSALFLGPNDIFTADTIGRDFQLQEQTLVTDAYDASLTLAAAYADAHG